MFRRSVSLKSAGGLVVRVKMASNKQGGFPNPNAKPYDGNRERHMEASESLPRFETSKDNGVQGGQFSNDGTHQNFENTPRPPGSYPHEMRGNYKGQGRGQRNYDRDGSQQGHYYGDPSNYRGRGRGQRNYDRDGSQQGHYYGDPKKVDSDQRHQQRVKPGPYQSDSLKDNRNQGHEQQAQSGPNQGDFQKGDMAQGNFMKSGMDQGYRQEAKTDSYQAHSQEGRGGVQDHGQGAEPISFQGHSQENINRDQHNENDSRQGLQAVFDQKDTQKGTEGDRAQGLEQGVEPDSYKGDVSKIQPVFDQNVSQKGKEGDHVQGAQPSCNKGNLKEGNDMGQSHGNDSIQRTPSASHQKDLQKSINYGQSHEKDSGQWNKFGPNQESWRKGENSSRGHYQDNSTHSYKGQEGSYSRQSSYGGGSRRDNFDQQQRKRNRADDEDDIFLSKTLSFLLRHGAEKQHFKLMPEDQQTQKTVNTKLQIPNLRLQKGSVIPEVEQKAIKKGPYISVGDDEGAPNGATEDEEDVKLENEWTTVSITNVEESQSAVEYILEHKLTEPVSIICSGEKQGDADGRITLLVISMQNNSWIYQLCNKTEDLMEAGKLKQLFFDRDLMKVFHDVTWQSAVLFKQYEIVLDGTKVFDSKVVCQMKLLDDKTIDILRLEGFMPSRWVEEDGKIDSSKWTEISLDQELIDKLVERCKALLQFYKMFTMQKVPQPKKETYTEVNKYVDKMRAKEIKKIYSSSRRKETFPSWWH